MRHVAFSEHVESTLAHVPSLVAFWPFAGFAWSKGRISVELKSSFSLPKLQETHPVSLSFVSCAQWQTVNCRRAPAVQKVQTENLRLERRSSSPPSLRTVSVAPARVLGFALTTGEERPAVVSHDEGWRRTEAKLPNVCVFSLSTRNHWAVCPQPVANLSQFLIGRQVRWVQLGLCDRQVVLETFSRFSLVLPGSTGSRGVRDGKEREGAALGHGMVFVAVLSKQENSGRRNPFLGSPIWLWLKEVESHNGRLGKWNPKTETCG